MRLFHIILENIYAFVPYLKLVKTMPLY